MTQENESSGYSTIETAVALGALAGLLVIGSAVVGTFFLGLADEAGTPAQHPGYAELQQTEFEVQSGELSVDSDDADDDVKRLKTGLHRFDGDLRSEERSEDSRRIRYSVEVRVADDEFEGFVDWIYDEYDVSSADVGYETVVVSGTRNEAQVLLDAMSVYDGVVEHYESRDSDELSSGDLDMLSRVTDQRLEVARELNDLNYDLEEVENRAERPTVDVVFTETLEKAMAPEDLRGDARASVSAGMDSVGEGFAALAAAPLNALALLLLVVRLGIYTLVVAVPLGLLYYAFARTIEDRI